MGLMFLFLTDHLWIGLQKGIVGEYRVDFIGNMRGGSLRIGYSMLGGSLLVHSIPRTRAWLLVVYKSLLLFATCSLLLVMGF